MFMFMIHVTDSILIEIIPFGGVTVKHGSSVWLMYSGHIFLLLRQMFQRHENKCACVTMMMCVHMRFLSCVNTTGMLYMKLSFDECVWFRGEVGWYYLLDAHSHWMTCAWFEWLCLCHWRHEGFTQHQKRDRRIITDRKTDSFRVLMLLSVMYHGGSERCCRFTIAYSTFDSVINPYGFDRSSVVYKVDPYANGSPSVNVFGWWLHDVVLGRVLTGSLIEACTWQCAKFSKRIHHLRLVWFYLFGVTRFIRDIHPTHTLLIKENDHVIGGTTQNCFVHRSISTLLFVQQATHVTPDSAGSSPRINHDIRSTQ